jgi:hypothetical protein
MKGIEYSLQQPCNSGTISIKGRHLYDKKSDDIIETAVFFNISPFCVRKNLLFIVYTLTLLVAKSFQY